VLVAVLADHAEEMARAFLDRAIQGEQIIPGIF
jgi:hypothetical protein